MSALRVHVEGVGVWSPQLANFAALRELLDGIEPTPPPARPAAITLPANERRRAPESVLLAVEVAGQAVVMSGRDARNLACVFASSHGDQPITDYMCATLANAPGELSPTRFHNSVHNAPVGYWTIATDCHAPSTALAAQRASFGAGLLEAACQVVAERRPVLLVCSDTAGSGPLNEVTGCTQAFACALVLTPERSIDTLACLDMTLTSGQDISELPEPLSGWSRGNPSATALALLAVLARGGGHCRVDASSGMQLRIDTQAMVAERAA
ncbi:beta-ketoacyl synthase chain length factor [Rhodanobacter sp. L36]|uniref:beta-ketoacyl synthase chain length factor n=1 Tax=Rhodanobacter sp. L36 TaxID=1747221 RepID=UPI00131B8A66|nr:beta-ketoacyl synthase chain length factor [Rhodanobacter sp. L36]